MKTDFSTSLYLGIKQGSDELRGWKSLTSGVPASFQEAPDAVALGKSFARLQGLEDGVVAPSTLHLFWDWFGGLNKRKEVIFIDEHNYRIGAWGAERAMGRGIRCIRFRHQSIIALLRLLRDSLGPEQRPIIVSDGWCPFCGKASPLHEYLDLIEPYNGLLVIDDTQALGVLGRNPTSAMPYGYGGGGLLPFLDINSKNVIAISSLAKAFGAPMAILSGSSLQVDAFRMRSETRVHASPPSAAALAAGKQALRQNAVNGNELRRKLLENVSLFKTSMFQAGITTNGGFFPVQTLAGLDENQVRQLHIVLWKQGIQTVPVMGHSKTPKLCWLLRAGHSREQILGASRTFLLCLKNNWRIPTYQPLKDSGDANRRFTLP